MHIAPSIDAVNVVMGVGQATTHPTPPTPSHASVPISLNVCHVTLDNPPHQPMPHHWPPHMTHPPHSPHPIPPTHSHTSLHISLNVCHFASFSF